MGVLTTKGQPGGLETTAGAQAKADAAAVKVRVLASSTPYAVPTKIHAFASVVMTVVGMNGAGRIWCRDGTNNNLSQSDNWGSSWTNMRGLPANTTTSTLMKVVPHAGYIYTVLEDSTAPGTYKVYRAADVATGSTLTWDAGPVFTMPANTHANVRSCFNAGTQNLFLGTYTGMGNDVAKVYRSPDGITWTEVLDVPGAHHVHCVAEDPYNAGHVYAALGDNASPVCIAKSTDHGLSWSTLVDGVGNANAWQSVQLSFSPMWVWAAGDRIGLSAMVFGRDGSGPYNASRNWHWNTAVPGGAGARTVTDLATTNTSTTVTSATAAFTSRDVGRLVVASGVPDKAWISAFTNSTTVTMSAASTATASGVTATIGGDRYHQIGYWGAVDPATESFYLVANDTSAAGNRRGVFFLPQVGGDLELFEADPLNGVAEVFAGNGFMWTGERKWKPIASVRISP
jgi:hypothetical protein